MTQAAAAPAGIGGFERLLSLWVALAIGAGLTLGNLAPGAFGALAALELASVNLVVAVLIWAMVYPMMVAVDFASLAHIGDRPKGLILTLAVNWLVKPFTMAALAVLFFEHVFAAWIAPAEAQQYIAGLILLGAAPCTAMVFVWSQLTRGDPAYTLVQVSVNDVIMVFAFAPIVALLLGVTDIAVPWETLILSVALYIVIPLAAGMATRRALGSAAAVGAFTERVKPLSMIGLLATVVLLFGFQGQVIFRQPLVIAMIAVPLLLQSYGIFALTYAAAWAWRLPFAVAAPCALIGTSNFFELAVAVAISLFGLNSGAALATVVGVLVEVPVMLSLVAFANRTAPLSLVRAQPFRPGDTVSESGFREKAARRAARGVFFRTDLGKAPAVRRPVRSPGSASSGARAVRHHCLLAIRLGKPRHGAQQGGVGKGR